MHSDDVTCQWCPLDVPQCHYQCMPSTPCNHNNNGHDNGKLTRWHIDSTAATTTTRYDVVTVNISLVVPAQVSQHDPISPIPIADNESSSTSLSAM
jgi:hypothetical protein